MARRCRTRASNEEDNKQADTLAKLASTLSMADKETRIPISKSWVIPPIFSDHEDDMFQEEENHITEGLDVVGPLTKSSGGHLYILAATDYFSKWDEAVPLKKVKKENVTNFMLTHIIYHYGVARYTITDNGKPFCNNLIDKLCQKFGFKQRNSSIYYVAANGLAKAFNKTLCNLLKKMVAKSKRDWHERIGEALWAYRTTVRTPTQATPYALVYGVEAVLPLEQQIPSLRIVIKKDLPRKKMLKYDLKY
ncbi:UNVERIFIED_CONTAM: hypothetical protein Scaly_2222300 [Sesamum calycinum]|uniref:Integrase catalytic domain-containing protein n=1 Tax=Sesamum calycinum TaxID=2727403 RepID=A0AAW2MBU6_9LAMI